MNSKEENCKDFHSIGNKVTTIWKLLEVFNDNTVELLAPMSTSFIWMITISTNNCEKKLEIEKKLEYLYSSIFSVLNSAINVNESSRLISKFLKHNDFSEFSTNLLMS